MYGERMTMTQSIRDSVQLAFRPPLDWPALLGFVALRATPGVEAVAAGVYRRTIASGGDTGTIEVRAAAAEPHLLMRVRLGRHERLLQVVERARRLFDLDADPGLIGGHLARSPELAPLVARRPGLRVPGAWDAFELAVRAVDEPDAFPAADLGLRRALGHGAAPLEPARVAELAEAWRPWRAYAAMHLWAGLAGEEGT